MAKALWATLFFTLLLSQSQAQDLEPVTGLPYVWSLVPREALQSDINNRTWQNITDQDWCVFDSAMRDWCGPNPLGSVYAYCIFTPNDEWPPSDPNWMDNALFAPVAFVYLPRPAFCACNHSHRAYWVNGGPTLVAPRFGYEPPCYGEHGLLAVFILLILFFGICGLWSLLEIALWVTLFITKTKSCTFSSAFLPKISGALLCVCLIIVLVIEVVNVHGNYELIFITTWFRILSYIFLTLTYIFWLVIFTDVTQKIRSLSVVSTKLAIFCLWTVFPFIVLILAGSVACVAVAYNNAQRLTADPNYQNKLYYYEQIESSSNAGSILGLVTSFIVCLWGSGLVIKSGYDIAHVEGEGSSLGENFDVYKRKAWLNFFATLFFWPIFVIQISYADGWMRAVQSIFAAAVLLCLLLALRTQLSKPDYLSQIVSIVTTASSSGGQKSDGPPSRRSSGRGVNNNPSPEKTKSPQPLRKEHEAPVIAAI